MVLVTKLHKQLNALVRDAVDQVGQPVAVYDPATKKVLLQVQNNSNFESVLAGRGWKAGQTWQTTSTDAGLTWAPRQSLDKALGQFAGLYPGPANAGIQLSAQGSPYKGRLVFAGWNVPTKNFSISNNNYVVSYWSTDSGRSFNTPSAAAAIGDSDVQPHAKGIVAEPTL
jgi:hypothetical protein